MYELLNKSVDLVCLFLLAILFEQLGLYVIRLQKIWVCLQNVMKIHLGVVQRANSLVYRRSVHEILSESFGLNVYQILLSHFNRTCEVLETLFEMVDSGAKLSVLKSKSMMPDLHQRCLVHLR